MRIPKTRLLMHEVPEIDIVLGGHDHVYHIEMCNDIFYVISGTDFEEFSDIKIHLNVEQDEADSFIQAHPNEHTYKVFYAQSKKLLVECKKVIIDNSVEPDPDTEKYVKKYTDKLNEDLEGVIIQSSNNLL